MNIKLIIVIIIAICFFVLLFSMLKRRKPVLSLALSAFSGILTLLLLSAYGGVIGLTAKANLFSLALSALFGMPGALLASLLPVLQNL